MTAGSILGGIAARLRKVYPEDFYSIYTESVEQGLFKPCFFILLKQEEQLRGLGKRFKQVYRFEVTYYPSDSGGENEECIAVSQTIQRLLEYISAGGDKVRGKAVSCKIENGKLIFIIDYTLFLIEQGEDEQLMMEVEVNEAAAGTKDAK